MDESALVRTVGITRIAFGVSAWVAPNVTAKLFGLDPASNPQGSFIARLFGIRDVALGIGLLSSRGDARPLWWQMGLIADTADTAAATLAGRTGIVPARAAVASGVFALATVAAGLAGLASSSG